MVYRTNYLALEFGDDRGVDDPNGNSVKRNIAGR
jgi:hypothetical protein